MKCKTRGRNGGIKTVAVPWKKFDFERVNFAGQREVVMDYPTMTDVHRHDLTKHCMFDVLKIPYMNDPEYMYTELPWDMTLRRFVFNTYTGEHTIYDFPSAAPSVRLVVPCVCGRGAYSS